jgi:hypothetical protein
MLRISAIGQHCRSYILLSELDFVVECGNDNPHRHLCSNKS